MISVLVLTHNDEATLGACLKSVAWSDDIVVFDAFSSDRTIEIARSHGARVVQRELDHQHDHRKAALSAGFKYPWLFIPAADEVTPSRLREELLSVAAASKHKEAAYRARYKFFFLGKWIKHAARYPDWVLRLVRSDQAAVSPAGEFVINGKVGSLSNHLDKYGFARGTMDWVARNNAHSTADAQLIAEALESGRIRLRSLLSPDPKRIREAIRTLSYRLPFRSFLVFWYLMVLRRGVFDGPLGWTYCRMAARYSFMVQAKLQERARLLRGEPPG